MTLIIGAIDWAGSRSFMLPVIALTMSMLIPIVAIITEHFRKRDKMRLVEKAIEHGVDLSGLKLDDECDSRPRQPYRAGMVTFAVGIGLGIVMMFVFATGTVFWILAAIGGAVCICVGLALLLNDWMNRDRFVQQSPRI